jgi:hypothetical protein
MRVVLDPSVLIKWLFNDPNQESLAAEGDRASEGGH